MAISRVGVSNLSVYDLDGTFVISKPANTAQGDVMFALINTYNGTPSSVPTGWSLVTNRNNASPSLGTYVYWKLAGGSEPSTYSWGLDPGFDLVANMAIHTYRGVNPTAPVSASISAVSTTAESLASGNVSVDTPGSWLLAVSGCRHSGTSGCTCTMANMSEQTDASAADTAGSFSRSMATYDSNGTVTPGTYSRTAVVTGTTLAHTVLLLAIEPQLDLAETLTDNFNDGVLNTSIWTTGAAGYDGPGIETNGRIEFHSSVGVNQYKGIYSAAFYDMRESYATIEVVQVFSGDDANLNALTAYDGVVGSPQYVQFSITNGNLIASNQSGDLLGFDTFDPVDHRFLRIRVSGSTWFCDTSSDCQTWTNYAQAASGLVGFSGSRVVLATEMLSFDSTSIAATGAIDNFNVVPIQHDEAATDVETLGDTATRVAGYSKSATDTEALSDSLARAQGFNRSTGDAEGLSDSLSVAKGLSKSASDTEQLGDSLTAVQDFSRSATDALGLSDALSVSIGRNVDFSDGLGLTDTTESDLEIGAQDFTFDWEDGLGLSDSAGSSQGFLRTESDGEDLSDSVERVAEYGRSAADALSLSDTAVAGLSVPRTTEDSESLSDTATAALGVTRSETDTVSLSDSVSAVLDHRYTANDSVRLSDIANVNGGSAIEPEDDLRLNDSLTRVAEYEREAEDVLGLSESLSAALDVSKGREDSESLSDAVTAALSLPRSVEDAVSLGDSVTVAIHRSIEVSDSVDLSDQTSVDQAFSEIVEDLVDLSDSVGWSLSLNVSDNLSLSDTADTDGGTSLRDYADTLTLSESVTVALVRTKVESLERLTNTGTLERVSRTEDIERTWRFDQWY